MNKNSLAEGDINLSPLRKKWQSEQLDDKTLNLLERDSNVFLHQSMSTPCLDVLCSCNGSNIVNLQSKKYLDFHGNNVHQVGFGNESVINAIKEQLDTLSFCSRRFTNEKAIQLAEKLISLTENKLKRVLFSPGATSSIGMAIKLARIATGKYKTISMWDSFHGASLDAISIGGESVFRNGLGPLLPGCEHVMPFNSYRCPFGECRDCGLKCVKYIEFVLEHEGDIGAIIIETIRNTDVQIPIKEYYRELRRICDKYGVLLIFDETAICLGRTGKWFAYQHYDVIPDMVVIGKGLGGGIMPMSALLVKEELNVASNTSIGHYTHEKSPVGCAAALATIEFIQKNNILQKVVDDGEFIRKKLTEISLSNNSIGDIRGIGLLNAIELVSNKITKEKNVQLAEKIMYDSLTDGLSFKVSQGNIISLYPPLTVTQGELLSALFILEKNFKNSNLCIC